MTQRYVLWHPERAPLAVRKGTFSGLICRLYAKKGHVRLHNTALEAITNCRLAYCGRTLILPVFSPTGNKNWKRRRISGLRKSRKKGKTGIQVALCQHGTCATPACCILSAANRHKGTTMILTTTPTIEGHTIREYKGVVTGETIIGANFVKDFFAGIRDIVGGRSGSYERVLIEGKDTSMREMQERAAKLGANAIVGIDIDYETVGQNGSMIMVATSGTAVVIE